MNKRTFIAALTIGLLAQCTYLENVHLLTNGKLYRKDFVETIPFELRKDIIVVKGFINQDSVAREFIFDTGAFNSKVAHTLANQLGLQAVTHKTNSTAQGITRKIEVTKMDSLRLGDTPFYNIGAGMVEYDEKSASPCLAPHGLIGANLMKLAHWKIDFQHQQIQFSDNPFSIDENLPSHQLPFKRPVLSGTPKVNLQIQGKMVENILFDVGYNGGLVLPYSLKDNFSSQQETIVFDRSTSGIYGSNTDTLVTKSLPVLIGGYKQQMPVAFSAIGKALLGNEVLKSFVVFIDYENDVITLQPFRPVGIPASKMFIPGILNDSLWIVNRTTPQIPLQLGDTLKYINGLQPQDVFNAYCDFVMHISKLYEQDTLTVELLNGQSITLPNMHIER